MEQSWKQGPFGCGLDLAPARYMDDPANALPPIPESGLSPEFAGEPLPAGAPLTNAPPAARRLSRGARRRLLALAGAGLAGLLAAAWLTGPWSAWFAGWGGPREIARAQLAEIDRGQVRAAYDLFSVRYRRQVTFEEWRDLMVTAGRSAARPPWREARPSQ